MVSLSLSRETQVSATLLTDPVPQSCLHCPLPNGDVMTQRDLAVLDQTIAEVNKTYRAQ